MAEPSYTFKDYHESRDANFSLQPGLKVKTTVFEGDYKTLEGYAEKLIVGKKASASSSSDMSGLDKDYFVANLQLVRTGGKRGRMAVTLSLWQDVEVWGLEMTEIQKPIKTWHADKEGEEKPDLNLLSNWESQAGKQGLESDYNAYKYKGESLTGATLTLAQMIREEGISHYVVYTPIITCTVRCNEVPEGIGKDIGKIGAPTSSEDNSPLSKLTPLAKQWLKTADRIQGAIDGTYTRIQQWTGADKWNPNLYGDGGGSSGDSGGNSGGDGGGSSGDSGGSGDGGGNSGGGLDIPDLPDTPNL